MQYYIIERDILSLIHDYTKLNELLVFLFKYTHSLSQSGQAIYSLSLSTLAKWQYAPKVAKRSIPWYYLAIREKSA